MELDRSIDPVVFSVTPSYPSFTRLIHAPQPSTHFQSGSLNKITNSDASIWFLGMRPSQCYYVLLSLQTTSQNTFSSVHVHEAYRGDLCAKKD